MECDEEALKFLKDIKWCRIDVPNGFKLEFFFDRIQSLKKTYHTIVEDDPIGESNWVIPYLLLYWNVLSPLSSSLFLFGVFCRTENEWYHGKSLTHRSSRRSQERDLRMPNPSQKLRIKSYGLRYTLTIVRKRYQSRTMESKDNGMKSTTEVLQNMKTNRLQAWDNEFLQRLEKKKI